jgi:Cu(I)/Ag(I) efflux system membrane fusion protein
MKKLWILVCIAALVACGENDKKGDGTKAVALSQGAASAEFNSAFAKVLTNYYHLKDAFVLSNDSLISKSANLFKADMDSLNLALMQADSAILLTADSYKQAISADASTIAAEKNVEERRKSFSTISENMFELIRVVRYSKEKVYQLHCPMAFNNAGANWLNNSADVKNPYFGIKMLSCGEAKDSLDFSGL